MPKPTKLQAAAASEKAKAKRLGLLASIAAALGLGSDAVPTAGKMRKVTETHKHVKLEEEEGGGSDSEEEEEEEEGTGSTGSTGSESSEASTGSEGSKSEEEEEEEEEEEKGEFPPKKKEKAKSEEEEEKAIASAVGRALNSASVHAAFKAALPKRLRETAEIYSPHRLAAYAKKATGSKTTYGAMHALANVKKAARSADASLLTKQAKLEQRVARVEGENRKARVDAIVKVAKETGRAGATTHDGREALRAFGMSHGSQALSKHLAAMPKVARTSAKIPRGDGSTGAPSASEQTSNIEAAALAGLTDEKDIKFVKDSMAAKMAKLNGAGAGTET